MASTRQYGENLRKDRFLVVSYSHKGSIEFVVIRESWKVDEFKLRDEDSDSGGEEKTEYFLWPKNWKNLTTKELEKLYEKEDPAPDWRKYEILRCHKKKAKLVEAKNARNRAEDDFNNKKKKLSEIGDTTDESSKTLGTRKSRTRKQIDDDFVGDGAKKMKTATMNFLSSKIYGSKDSGPVFAKKSIAESQESIRHRQHLVPVVHRAIEYPTTSTSSVLQPDSSLLSAPRQYSPPPPCTPQLPISPNRNRSGNALSNGHICTTPRSRSSLLNMRTPRTVDAFLKALGEEKFQEGIPVDGVQFKFYMTGMFLGIKSLQSDMTLMRNSAPGSSAQAPPPSLGPKPMDIEWPLNPRSFTQQEDSLGDEYLFEEMSFWLSCTNNTLYSMKYGEMAKNILQKMFPVELQTSFVFSKHSYSKTEVRFESTRTCKLVTRALEKAHGSGKETLCKYRDAIQFWWDHKADNFREYLRRKQNSQILARFGDDSMLMRDRIKLFKDHHALVNELDPEKFAYNVDKM